MGNRADDEKAFLTEIKKLIRGARKKQEIMRVACDEVFQLLMSEGIDLDAPTEAENASNLCEAISCFIVYGEYSLPDLLKEIKVQYRAAQRQTTEAETGGATWARN